MTSRGVICAGCGINDAPLCDYRRMRVCVAFDGECR